MFRRLVTTSQGRSKEKLNPGGHPHRGGGRQGHWEANDANPTILDRLSASLTRSASAAAAEQETRTEWSGRLSRPAGLLGAASFRSFARSLSEEAFAEVWSQLKKVLISVVYGSNLIESAGQDLPITIKICQDVFDGKEVDPNIPEHDPEYKQHLENLLKTYRKCDMPNVIRSRLEVINHAKALNYMSNKVVLNNEEVSEAFILQTHRILLEGVGGDIEPGVS
ncbi:hypothetical protein G6O67_008364 [Ophiocordyceps sinensis]|uniref:Uncharacterized protein n=2 Tax=Ophiocordyceps sinensis TaxID=72228 RepID=A0A8H4LSB7_9HYPO|nr:fic/DOC family protein [Ophiocordyceps sinensis CO18]KAF4504177.1 hypothetical protein G6O67_008364 [Ophiocordyceps sinensis]